MGRTDPNDSAMHARRAGEATGDEANALLEERLAQHRQHRVQRLHALRQERNLMRSLLSGTSSEDGPSSSRAFGAPGNGSDPTRIGESNTLRPDGSGPAADPSRSPGAIWRRRGLGEFLRGFGAGGGRGLISMFDEDFPSFWGRDSAALDPRNYLVSAVVLDLSDENADPRRFGRTMTNSTRLMKPSSACQNDSATQGPRASLPRSSPLSRNSSTASGRCRNERVVLRPRLWSRRRWRARAASRSSKIRRRWRAKVLRRRNGAGSASATTLTTTNACSVTVVTASTKSA